MFESKFIEIDYDNWDRKDIYEDYSDMAYFVTVDVDITRYIENYKDKVKFYPFMSYVASRVVNEHTEYRMALKDGKIGYYETVHPIYTLLRRNSNHLFTHKVTKYSADFATFYNNFVRDKEIGETCNALYADGFRPHNSFAISTMPHIAFSQVGIVYDVRESDEFIPFSTFGKYYEKNGRWYCPVATEFFHSVNDGYHAEQFYLYMQEIIDNLTIDTDSIKNLH